MSEEQLAKAAFNVEKEFKIALLDQGMTQKELAKMLHTSQAQISLAIKGAMTPNARELRKQMMEILHIEK